MGHWRAVFPLLERLIDRGHTVVVCNTASFLQSHPAPRGCLNYAYGCDPEIPERGEHWGDVLLFIKEMCLSLESEIPWRQQHWPLGNSMGAAQIPRVVIADNLALWAQVWQSSLRPRQNLALVPETVRIRWFHYHSFIYLDRSWGWLYVRINLGWALQVSGIREWIKLIGQFVQMRRRYPGLVRDFMFAQKGSHLHSLPRDWFPQALQHRPGHHFGLALSRSTDSQWAAVGPRAFPKLRDRETLRIYLSMGTAISGRDQQTRNWIRLLQAWQQHLVRNCGIELQVRGVGPQECSAPGLDFQPWRDQISDLQWADVFVTHGGLNGLIQGMIAGSSLWVLPHSPEQDMNARVFARRGYARLLPKWILDPQSQSRALKWLMQNLEQMDAG